MAGRRDFHFADRIAAGTTRMTDPRSAIERRGGMAGWILNATVAGGGSIGGGVARYRSRPGDLVLFAPTAVHDYHLDSEVGRWTHLWVYFYPRDHWQAWLRWDEIAPGIQRLRLPQRDWVEVVAVFERLVVTVTGGQELAAELGMCLLEQILILCRRATGGDGARLDPRIAHAVEWLAAHYPQRIDLAELAAACGMSPSRLSHRFREQMGVAPMRYLERLRIDRAREQLAMSGRSITEIAAAVGFADPDWFARVFKRRTGAAPRAFRLRGS